MEDAAHLSSTAAYVLQHLAPAAQLHPLPNADQFLLSSVLTKQLFEPHQLLL